MIDLVDVTKSYGKGLPALSHVNLHVEKGEFVFIVGSSGSGKSTMIKLLLKELDQTSGSITVNGECLDRMKHRKIPGYRRKLGVVFQDFRLLKDRSVYENVAFAQRVVGLPTRTIRRRVPAVLQASPVLRVPAALRASPVLRVPVVLQDHPHPRASPGNLPEKDLIITTHINMMIPKISGMIMKMTLRITKTQRITGKNIISKIIPH